jgi:adenosylmethionine---8-amino-7-oxononanoate aminotransferase
VEAPSHKSSWTLRDQTCIWHPFTQAQTAAAPIPMIKGKGSYLYSESGDAYLDGISSWWVNLHGHGHPYIAGKIFSQARELEHVLFANFTHPQAIVLAERLLSLLPSGYSRVFYSDNGSTAVEVALKMAFQGSVGKKRILSFKGAYHGDTFGAMASAGKTHYNRPFWPYLFEVRSIIPPTPGKESESWEQCKTALHSGDVAAFIFEPLIQGAGGMRLHSKEILVKMIAACQSQGILAIADEVMTGFGRTGPLFACSRLGVSPDLICLSKGITGGFIPLGATIAKESLYASFLSPDPAMAFLHGHSYTANPLSCAAANASLDLLLRPECAAARSRIESEHRQFQWRWKNHPKLERCDVLGTILAVEYKSEKGSYYDPIKEKLTKFFQKRGLLVRPLGNVLYLIPPYCISGEELSRFYSAIAITLEEGLW